MSLILLPAVDVVDGKAVRLVQGKAGSETDYGSALEAAQTWQRDGAEWVHLVDLDAAFGRGSNRELLAEVVGKLDVAVELGVADAALDPFMEQTAGEKERDALCLLLITTLGPWQIILQKYISQLVPILSFLFFVVLFRSGVPHDMPVAVLDQDNTPLSRQLVRMIDATPSAKVPTLPAPLATAPKPLTCRTRSTTTKPT